MNIPAWSLRSWSWSRVVGLTLKILWCSAAMAVLVTMLWHFDPHDPEERDNPILFAYLMFALTYPSGLLAAFVASIALGLVERFVSLNTAPSRLYDYILPWIGFVCVGYWQWFKLAPWLWNKLLVVLLPWLRRKLGSG